MTTYELAVTVCGRLRDYRPCADRLPSVSRMGNLGDRMEIKVTVTMGSAGSYKATFHPTHEPASADRRPDEGQVPAKAVPANTSVLAPGLSISLPASAASIPV